MNASIVINEVETCERHTLANGNGWLIIIKFTDGKELRLTSYKQRED